MKQIYIRIIFVLILISSLGNFAVIHIEKSDSIELVDEGPKPAASANLAAWILIAGDRSDHELLFHIRNGVNEVHQALINRGFMAEDIYYLDPTYSTFSNPLSPYRDADTTLANIQYAIETWAAGKVDATHGLGIYLFDHGGIGYTVLPGANLHDYELNTYLNNLETSTGVNRTILIYEACHSGSFINPVSKDNRIVVAATDITHNSYVNAGNDWAVFSESFWSSIQQCKTIGEAFEDAEESVHALGYGNAQIPWIDDNHDEIGNEVDSMGDLPNGGDGSDALNVWIGSGANCIQIYIPRRQLRFYLPIIPIVIPVWVVVDTNSILDRVYIRIVPPSWVPQIGPPEDPQGEEGKSLVQDAGVLIVELFDSDGDGNFTGELYRQNPKFWEDEGDYKMNLFAETEEGVTAKIESTIITVTDNPAGTPPPDNTLPSISITTPSPNTMISGIVSVIAKGDDDQVLDKIQIFVDGDLVKEEIMPSYLPYPEAVYNLDSSLYSSGLHTISATAFDGAGNNNTASIVVSIGSTAIPGFDIPLLIVGSTLGIISIFAIRFKNGSRKKLKKYRN